MIRVGLSRFRLEEERETAKIRGAVPRFAADPDVSVERLARRRERLADRTLNVERMHVHESYMLRPRRLSAPMPFIS